MLKPPLKSPGLLLKKEIGRNPILLPGVFNPISALSAARAGARGLYISGAGISNAQLGVPDIALVSLTEFSEVASRITSIVQLPAISDADTGFGDALNTVRCVIEMERAGLAGIHLEDQLSPKRCGHLDGKSLIETEHFQSKIRAASSAKSDPSFWIIARTDARGVEGLDSAIDRAKAYVKAGADAIFPEGLQSIEEFKAFRDAISVPLLANMTEFGKTPIIAFEEFSRIGYEMVIYPMTAFRVMLKALDDAYTELISTGTQKGLIEKMRTRSELYDLIDYPFYSKLDQFFTEDS